MFIIVQLHSYACLISLTVVILVFLQADSFTIFEINNYQISILPLFFFYSTIDYIFDLIKSNKIIRYIKLFLP